MRHGDISNKQAPFIGFDIDSLLFEEEEPKNIVEKIKAVLKSEKTLFMEREYNKSFVSHVRRIWNDHDVCILFFTGRLHDEELEELANKLDMDGVPFTNLIEYTEWDEIRILLGSNQLLYFFSDNDSMLSYLSSKHAKKMDEVRSVLG